VYSEYLTQKVMSGGGVKAPPRHLDKSPRELKAQEGIELLAGLNRLSSITDRCSDECPEGDAIGSGSGGVTRRKVNFANDMRVRLVDEASRLGSGENP
jgi:hypothetical protein